MRLVNANEVKSMHNKEDERNRGRGAITPNYRYWPDNWLLKANNEEDEASKAAKESIADKQPDPHEH